MNFQRFIVATLILFVILGGLILALVLGISAGKAVVAGGHAWIKNAADGYQRDPAVMRK